MKIAILDAYTVNPGDMNWDAIAALGELTAWDATTPEETVSHIGDAEIVLTNKVLITKEVMEACPNLKLICVLATGFNVIDCQEAARRNIPVCNVPAYSTDSVAQLTFALLLELCHHVGHHSRTVHEGKWIRSPHFTYWDYPQTELVGKTMGIIGFGKIGRAVGKLANAFGMKVLAYNRSRCPEGEAIGTYVDLDTVLKQSDVLTLHCPLTEQTKGLINAETIAKMKDGAILLNTSRGPVVDEAALAQALKDGKLAGAGLDVLCTEPMLPDCPLLGAPNCMITPHIAWSPTEARLRLMKITENNIRSFLEGKVINRVN